ncbi:hypothetical protein OlV1_022 [Ostreococcus lucimarinus virus 1]|uniref:hypothetical protein n=1 Tax=Ostreococcus lucimarinus virus 1 TaxID=880162 RepID=UPI0001EF454A|nr:hypothetical protein OlV1_022 [Ostreococcus lucimarinus virus 1]ADQ91399.1 hypothetical protein OlV1_022 [Ostreococcus lucimarinus virus 1]
MFILVIRCLKISRFVYPGLNVSVIKLSVCKFPHFVSRRFLCVIRSFCQVPKKGSFENMITNNNVCDEHLRVNFCVYSINLGY